MDASSPRAVAFVVVLAGCTSPATVVDAGTAAAHVQPASAAPADAEVFNDFPAGSVPLERIKLRATHPGKNPTADIELPNGHVLTLKVGSLIGTRLGQVTSIADGAVVVTEEPRDATGKRIPTKVELHVAN